MGAPGLVGRDAELRRLRRVLASDGPSALVVGGAPGIGKTRLLTEIATEAARSGWAVERLTGSHATRSIGFGAIAHLLPDEVADDDTSLFRAARNELRRRASDGALLLLVDDGHLLDDGSAALVRTVAARRDVRVLLSQRSGEVPSHEIVSLWKDGHAERVELQPLSRAETDLLIGYVLGGPATPAARESVWRLTLGHPLFVVTALEAAREGGVAVEGADGWDLRAPLAHQVQLGDLVLSRLRGLDDAAMEAFQAVALAEPVPEEIVLAVAAAGSLAPLHERGLLLVSESGDGRRISTPHPLYAEVVVHAMAPDRRRSIAGRIADAVLARPRVLAGDRLHAALWLLAAGRPLGYDLALAASREAMARDDHVSAARLARGAVEERPGDTAACVALGSALEYTGDGDAADEALRAADPQTPDEIAEVALRRSHVLAFVAGRPLEGAALLRVAAPLVPAHRRPHLDTERAMYEAMVGGFAATFDVADAALAAGGLSEDLRLHIELNRNVASAMTGRLDGFEHEVQRLLAQAARRRIGPTRTRGQLMLNRTVAWLGSGQLDEGRARCIAWIEAEDLSGRPDPMMVSRLAVLEAARGDMRAAVDASARALVQAERWDPFRFRLQIVGQLVLHQAQTGSVPADAARRLESATFAAGDETRPLLWLGRARAWLTATSGDLDAAADIAAREGARAIERDHLTWGIPVLHDAVRFGRPDVVRDVLASAVARTTGASLLVIMAAHADALMNGDLDDLTAAGRRFAAAGARSLAAEVYAQAARLARARGDTGAAARNELLAGMLIEHCPDAATPAIAGVGEILSDREREIAQLARTGMRSKDIARHLVLSVRTVDNHLRSVYRKLEVAGREELHDVLAGAPEGVLSSEPEPVE